MDKLSKLAERYPTRGFDEYYQKIRREGLKWNRKRVLRVYRAMKLSLRRKYKKRIIKRRTIHQLQKLSNQWKNEYNYNHPHKSLGNKSPIEFKSRFDEEVNFFIKKQLNKNYLSNFEVS